MISVKVSGQGLQSLQKALSKTAREGRRQIGSRWRSVLREAAAYGRGLIGGLFRGRGKRFRKAFRYSVRIRADDVVGRVGYLFSKKQDSWAWLGKAWEKGIHVRHRSKSGRVFVRGSRVSGHTREGRALARAGVSGSRKLWIPIGINRGPGGGASVSPSQFYQQFQGRSVVKQSKSGSLIAFAVTDGKLTPMFVLKDEVRHAQRPAATPTARKYLPIITDATGQQIFSNFRGLA